MIIYIPINPDKPGYKEEQGRCLGGFILSGWVSKGRIELKDPFGQKMTFEILERNEERFTSITTTVKNGNIISIKQEDI